jgi:xylulokinase
MAGGSGSSPIDGTLVAGVDSSTQSTKVVLVEAATGRVVGAGSAPHPDGTETDPAAWWDALGRAGDGLLERAAAIGIGAQQHGLVVLDDAGAVLRPALLWNDLRSAADADRLVAELGGPQRCAELTGSVFTASFTVTKLRWVAANEPDVAGRIAAVALPHDWLTRRLTGGELATDAGDASGTGYFDPATRSWRPEIAELALGHPVSLPTIAAPSAVVGRTAGGAAVSAGTGDNMAAALGLDLRTGDVVVSIGTSGTAFAVAAEPSADASGLVAGFCDATGRYLPLACTINASRILSTTARLLGRSLDEFDALARAAAPGARGVTLLPYLDGERTPNRPSATGIFAGVTSTTEAADLARAAVEGLLCSLADAVDALGIAPARVVLIGGGSRSEAVQELAPAFLGAEVTVPEAAEYVALGAARQAAWALAGTPEPPQWEPAPARRVALDAADAAASRAVRERYARLRDRTAPWV